jgi:hypothetical protein
MVKKDILPRNEGNMCWGMQKYHEMFYLVHDMVRCGSPVTFDFGGIGEKFHNSNPKIASSNCPIVYVLTTLNHP